MPNNGAAFPFCILMAKWHWILSVMSTLLTALFCSRVGSSPELWVLWFQAWASWQWLFTLREWLQLYQRWRCPKLQWSFEDAPSIGKDAPGSSEPDGQEAPSEPGSQNAPGAGPDAPSPSEPGSQDAPCHRRQILSQNHHRPKVLFNTIKKFLKPSNCPFTPNEVITKIFCRRKTDGISLSISANSANFSVVSAVIHINDKSTNNLQKHIQWSR